MRHARVNNCVMLRWPEGKTACFERKELYCLKFLCIKYRTNKLQWESSIGCCGIFVFPLGLSLLQVSHSADTYKSRLEKPSLGLCSVGVINTGRAQHRVLLQRGFLYIPPSPLLFSLPLSLFLLSVPPFLSYCHSSLFLF